MKTKFKGIACLILLSLIALLTSCDLSIKPNFGDSKEEYTVTYYINSDTLDNIDVTYEKNTELNLNLILTSALNNVTPTKTGYKDYTGDWYKDSNYSNAVSFPLIITEDISLYLKWDLLEISEDLENKYTVTYYIENEEIGKEYVEENGSAKGITAPNKEGYTFKGWYTNKTLTTKYNFSNSISNNLKLFGGYSINEYEVEFINGINNSVISKQTIQYNKKANKPVDPTLDHYEFINWYSDSNFTTIFDFNTTITNNTKIYAKFNPVESFTVEFLDKDGNKVAEDQLVDENSCATQPSNPTKVNHRFDGWYTDLEFTDVFEFTNKITSNTKVYAKFTYVELSGTEIIINKSGGYNEGAFVEFTKLANTSASNYTVSYKLNGSTTETQIDSELIREDDLNVRADILGLKAGTYSIIIKSKISDVSKTISNIVVSNYDRSGYAHFNNNSGVGAYNNDGTLKSNTTIVYVNDSNKNTVTATINGKTYTGLVSILQNQSKSSNPLVIRIIGRIGAATWKSIKYNVSSLPASAATGANGALLSKESMNEEKVISSGYNTLDTTVATKLNGLTNKVLYKSGEFDSYFNMLDISEASNVTVEGVGCNAELFQWGFTWSKCKSIEVRNLTFTDYTEDACSFQGGSNSDVNTYGNYWIHNNVFNKGNNNWDLTYEQDKPAGDGATDFKYCNSITSSYNKFNQCKKTGLVGGSDSVYTKSVTFHHNYYNNVGSRLPLGRQANMHIYNNYYYKCGTAQDIRANAFVLSEANYFEECTNPQKVTITDTYKYTVIKSYGDYLTGCGDSYATVVSSRTASLTGNCLPDGSTNYTNFDTNSSLFYYDSTNNKSKVTLLTTAAQAKLDCIALAGVLTGSSFVSNGNNNSSSNETTDDESNNTSDSSQTTPITNSTVLTFNNFSTGDISSETTVDNITVYPKTGKTCKITSCEQTIESTNITKYVSFGGGGSFTELNAKITTAKKTNITVYFESGTAGRTVKLMTSDNSTVATTLTTAGGIVSYTFANCEANTYAIASNNSSINIYCIVIEYVD